MSDDTVSRPPRDNLVRALSPGFEPRVDDAAGMPTLFGHFARFGEWTEIDSVFEGRFMERIAPGAFSKTFGENRDAFRILFQHGRDPQVGDKPLAAVSDLREDSVGAYYEGQLLDTSYVRDILPGLKAGVYGASMRFRVMREELREEPGVSDHNPEGIPERTVKEAQVMEAGPVTFPAYAGATASVRSLTDEFMFDRLTKDPAHLRDVIEYVREDPKPTSVSPSTDTTVTIHAPTPAPATSERTDRKDEHVADIDRFDTVELLVTRRDEIDERRKYLHAEYAGKAFPPEIQREWDDLATEKDEILERVEHLRQREAAILEASHSRTNVEPPVTQHYNVAPVTKVENIYDLDATRQAASSPDEERRLLRDSMARSLDTSTIAHPAADQARAKEAVAKTIEKLDRQGELAAYMLATANPAYRRAFGKWATSGGQLPLNPEEARAIEQARNYEERAFTLASTGLPVPYQLDPTIIPISNSSVNPYRAISRVEQTTVKEWRGATSAGITAAYAAEGTETVDNTPTLAQPVVQAHRAQAFIPFSIEVQQDWSIIEAEMARELQDAKDDLEATKFTLGSGTNEPFGLIVGATTTVGTTTTGTFVIADLYKMEEAVPARFRPRADIVGNRAIFNKVRQFDTAGGSGVWLDGLQPGLANLAPVATASLGPRVIGYPAYEITAMDAVLTTGSEILVMGDFRYFLIVDRVGMSVDLIPHLFGTTANFPTGQRGLYAMWRNGSKVLNAAAFRTLTT